MLHFQLRNFMKEDFTLKKKGEDEMESNSWRTIVLDNHESLGICNNQMVMKQDDNDISIPVEQIREILITSDKGSISLPLLVKLASQNTKVVFCDGRKMPVCELNGLNQRFEAAGKLMDQISWTERRKNAVWQFLYPV